MIGLMFLQELMLVIAMDHVNVFFVVIITLLKRILDFNQEYAMFDIIQCKRLSILMMLKLLLLKEMSTEFNFSCRVTMRLQTEWIMLM